MNFYQFSALHPYSPPVFMRFSKSLKPAKQTKLAESEIPKDALKHRICNIYRNSNLQKNSGFLYIVHNEVDISA